MSTVESFDLLNLQNFQITLLFSPFARFHTHTAFAIATNDIEYDKMLLAFVNAIEFGPISMALITFRFAIISNHSEQDNTLFNINMNKHIAMANRECEREGRKKQSRNPV